MRTFWNCFGFYLSRSFDALPSLIPLCLRNYIFAITRVEIKPRCLASYGGFIIFVALQEIKRPALVRSLSMQVWCNFTHRRFAATRAQLISMAEIHYYVIRYAVNDPFVFDIAAALNGLRRSRSVNWSENPN